MKNYQVYVHTFPNGKKYVGCSVDAKARWASGHGYIQNEQMYNDILHYGWKNIVHEILYENLSKEDAYQLESKLIIEMKTYQDKFGYNKSQGSVEGVAHFSKDGIRRLAKAMATRVVSEESRAKMRTAKKGTAFHTKPHSDETKKLISQNRKGKRAKDKHPMAKPVYCVELDKVFLYAKQAEEETGVSRSHICQVCKGTRKTAGKMHWEYYKPILNS